MIKTRIQNYQAIRDSEISTDGFACVVGNNSVGKSSIYRAIKGSTQNESGSSRITHGESKSIVDFKHDDLEFKWINPRNNGSTYELNGQEYDKIGRGAFDELMECGLAPVEAGPDEFYLQFWGQMKPYLICNRPDTRKFQLLSAIFDSDKFNDVLSEMKSDKKTIRDEIKDKQAVKANTETKIETKQTELECYEPLDQTDVDTIEDTVNRYTSIVDLNKRYESTLNEFNGLVSVLDSVNNIDYTIDVSDKFDALETIVDLDTKYNTKSEQYKQVDNTLDTVSEIEYEIDIHDQIERLEQVTELLNEYNSVVDELESLETLMNMKVPIENALQNLIDTYNEYESFYKLYQEYTYKKIKLNGVNEKINEVKSEKDEIELKLNELESELDECPTCGSKL